MNFAYALTGHLLRLKFSSLRRFLVVVATGFGTLPPLTAQETLQTRAFPINGTTWDKTLWELDRVPPTTPYQTGPNVQPAGSDFWTVGAKLFAYGNVAGDLQLQRSDDAFYYQTIGAIGPEGTTPLLPIFGKNESSFYINNNGSVSFGAGYWEYNTNLTSYRGPGALLSVFGADVDTRTGTRTASGNPASDLIRYRTVQSATELAAIGQRVASAQPGLDTFSPIFAEVITWDHVGVYPGTTNNPSTFQMVIASDGLQSYVLYLYPNRAIWWDRGTAAPPDSFAKVGVADGTGNIVMEAAASGTSAVRDLWFLSNAENGAAGTFIFQIGNSTATLDVNGTHTLPTTEGTAVTALTFADNAAGHTVTSSTVAGSLLFNSLRFANPNQAATFTNKTVALANAADAIIHGNLNFTDNTVLVARVANAVNGGTITLAKGAKLQLYAANATTAATTLRFDNSAGAGGGTFDLRGYDTTIGGLSSINATGGVITNSGTTLATLTSSFNDATHTFGGVLQNGTASLALAKAGTGTLVLTGANTFGGGVRLSAGTLQLGSASAIGSSGSILFTGGTLQFTAANTTDYSARFSNAANQSLRFDTNGQNVTLATALTIAGGSLTKLGAGTLTLGASATYNGATVVRGGTLTASVANALSPNSALFIVDGATVSLNGRNQTVGDLDSYDATTGLNDAGTVNLGGATLTNLNRVTNNWAGTLTGSGTVIKQGTATMNWFGQNDFTGTLQIDAGTLSTRTLNTLSPNATVAIASGASLNLNGGAQTIAGLSGAGSVVLGSGTLTLQLAADQTLATPITGTGGLTKSGAGTLSIAESATLYTGTTRIASGTAKFLGAISPGNFVVDSGARLEFSGTSFATSRLSGSGTLQTDAELTSSATQTLGVALTGTMRLTHQGPGTLTLIAASTYSGATVVRGGTLAPATVDALSANSAYFLLGNSTLNLAGKNQTVGDIDSYNSATGLLEASTINLAGATLTNLTRVTNLWAGTLSGTGTLIEQGSAEMKWYAPNSFTGALRIDAGKVSAQTVNVLSPNASVALATGATLQLNGHAQTIAGLSGTGTVSLGSAALTSNQAGDSTFAGTITGTGRVDKGGAGTLALSTANTYSGGTTLNLGTLVAGHTSALGTGTVRVNAGTLDLANLAVANALDVRGGTLTGLANYTGTQTLSAALNYAGTVGGALVVAHGGALNTTGATFTGATTVNAGGTLRGAGSLAALTLNAGATLTPGNSPGTLTVTGDTTWHGGATYAWEINDAFSPATSAGTAYDLVSISGSLTLAATSENKFTLSLVSLLANNTAGDVLNFNSAVNSSYTIATATGGIFGFDANAFTINSAAFTNSLAGGTWSLALANTNRDLQLHFTAAAIPEPSTYAALAGALALALAAWRRRRRTVRVGTDGV